MTEHRCREGGKRLRRTEARSFHGLLSPKSDKNYNSKPWNPQTLKLVMWSLNPGEKAQPKLNYAVCRMQTGNFTLIRLEFQHSIIWCTIFWHAHYSWKASTEPIYQSLKSKDHLDLRGNLSELLGCWIWIRIHVRFGNFVDSAPDMVCAHASVCLSVCTCMHTCNLFYIYFIYNSFVHIYNNIMHALHNR